MVIYMAVEEEPGDSSQGFLAIDLIHTDGALVYYYMNEKQHLRLILKQ